MPFVTKLAFQSGDRAVLDRVVTDIKETAERKGVDLKGPHTEPTRSLSVPQYKRLDTTDTFQPWRYTVYKRTIEIIGYDDFARSVADRDYPAGIHVGIEVDRVKAPGSR
jgi:small subunit ribosomal protein S10